jgi:hypothetical protein
MGEDLGRYRIVHFATHALLNNDHPELSGIVLSLVDQQGRSTDGFLRLNEIYNLNLSADLVVLSACETGLGKQIKKERLIGLARGFMAAGAQRVVSSLWKVDDEATAELMGRFYERILKGRTRARRPAPRAVGHESARPLARRLFLGRLPNGRRMEVGRAFLPAADLSGQRPRVGLPTKKVPLRPSLEKRAPSSRGISLIYKTDRTRRNAELKSKAARRESTADRFFIPSGGGRFFGPP